MTVPFQEPTFWTNPVVDPPPAPYVPTTTSDRVGGFIRPKLRPKTFEWTFSVFTTGYDGTRLKSYTPVPFVVWADTYDDACAKILGALGEHPHHSFGTTRKYSPTLVSAKEVEL